MFKKSAIASLVLVLLSSAAHSTESLTSQQDIHGRSVASIVANLAEYQGINASLVEAYGDKILVHATDGDGATRVLFVDKDTLRPLTGASRVGTQLDVVEVQRSGGASHWADEPARSLVESDDDSSDNATGY